MAFALSNAAGDFKGVMFLDAALVAALFKIGFGLSIIGLGYVLIYSYKHRKYSKIKNAIDE